MEDSLAEMKKAVFSVQMDLLHGVADGCRLEAAEGILTQSEYGDVVTERTISKLCGYPPCPHPLPSTFPRKGNYRISLRHHKVYDIRETRLFCSADCLIASRAFAESLAPSRNSLADCQKVVDLAAAFQRSGITNLKEPDPAQSLSPLKIHEQEQCMVGSGFVAPGPSNAIEGYVPRGIHGRTQPEKTTEGGQPDRSLQKDVRKSALKRRARVSANKQAEMISEDSFTSCIIMKNDSHKASEVPVSGTRRNKDRHLRVSWADHKAPQKMEVDDISKVSESERNDTEQPRSKQEVSDLNLVESASDFPRSSKELVSTNNTILEKGHTSAEDANNDRIASAEVVAAALTEAAAIVASEETDCSEAVARAGITICPSHYGKKEPGAPDLHVEGNSKTLCTRETEAELSEEELDTEAGDQMGWWISEPPEGFKAELSAFGTIWMALDGWISAASIAHIYGRDVSEENNFMFINGREYARQVRGRGSISTEIERTMSGCFSRALPGVVEALRLSTPISTLEQALGRLLRTMSCTEAVPPFGTKQWHMIVALLLDALSVQCLPSLQSQLANKRGLLRKLLDAAQTTEVAYETFKDLVLPMGRQPEFAARCGA